MASAKKSSIESKLKNLETAVDKLNGENTQIEAALEIFVRAMEQINELNLELEAAQQRVSTVLLANSQVDGPDSKES